MDADFFTRVIGQPVSLAEPRGRLSEHSIISELTSWRSGRATGLFPYRLRLSGGDREVIVKVKSRDGDVIAVGEALARICDASLANAYTRWSDRLGVLGAGRREQAIYAQEDPRFLAHAPALLGSTVDPASGAVTLVIERITDALVHHSLPDTSWTPAYVDCAIRGLAALQAIWIGRTAALQRQPWIGHVSSASSVAEMTDFWYALASHARPRLTDWTDGSITSIQERLIDTVGTWWRGLDAGPRTLIHNDFNPRNVCIRDSQRGPRLAAYDWELATIGAPQHDLAELLCFVLPPRATRAETAGWIERHRVLLERESGLHLDRDEWEYGFRASVRDLMLNRLPMYCLIDRVRRQPFLPRVVRTWWRIHEWFPL
jgi:hydroxymethylglutaryl-CoA reductase (NADPH)